MSTLSTNFLAIRLPDGLGQWGTLEGNQGGEKEEERQESGREEGQASSMQACLRLAWSPE